MPMVHLVLELQRATLSYGGVELVFDGPVALALGKDGSAALVAIDETVAHLEEVTRKHAHETGISSVVNLDDSDAWQAKVLRRRPLTKVEEDTCRTELCLVSPFFAPVRAWGIPEAVLQFAFFELKSKSGRALFCRWLRVDIDSKFSPEEASSLLLSTMSCSASPLLEARYRGRAWKRGIAQMLAKYLRLLAPWAMFIVALRLIPQKMFVWSLPLFLLLVVWGTWQERRERTELGDRTRFAAELRGKSGPA